MAVLAIIAAMLTIRDHRRLEWLRWRTLPR